MQNMLIRVFILLAACSMTTAAQNATLLPLRGDRLAPSMREIATLLPAGAKITVTPHQQFTVSATSAPPLVVIPLLYADLSLTQKRTSPDVCGAAFKEGTQTAYFVTLVGVLDSPGFLSSPCAGTVAMGKALDPGPRPRLIMIFAVTSMHGDNFALPRLE